MSWNVIGAFIGEVETPLLPAPFPESDDELEESDKDTRSLTFPTFLAMYIHPIQ